jgi:putative MATE family efflux protein
MAQRIRNMTQGSPLKLLITFALPLMAGNVFQQLYTIVDTAVVGQVLGVGALAALGSADWPNWMVLGIIQGITQGFSILMAQHFGAGDHRELSRSIGTSITLCTISAVVLLVCGQAAAYPVLKLLNTPDNIMGNALLYLRIVFGGIPVIMAYNLLASILRAMGDSKTPLYAMIVAALINVGLDLLFVMGFHWGVAGAAIATVIAQVFSSIYCFLNIRKITVIKLQKSDFRLRGNQTGTLLKLSSPIALQNAIIAVGGMVVQSVINHYGMLFIAGFTATNKLYGLLEIAATSYGYAVTSYVGQNLGAKLLSRIKKGMHSATIVALATSAVILAAMLLFGKLFLSLFISGTPEEVSQSMDIAYHYLSIMAIFLPILYMLHIYRSALMGLGDTVVPMLSGFAEMAMRIGVAVLLPLAIGQEGIFYAEVAAWTAAAVILVLAYFVRVHRLSLQKESWK